MNRPIDNKSILLPGNIITKLESMSIKAGFTSVSEYIAFILEQIIAKSDRESIKKENKAEDDKEQVKVLKDLGYL